MISLTTGANTPLPAGQDQLTLQLAWSAPPSIELDVSAFRLDNSGKVSGDADMIFYNQPHDPEGSLQFSATSNSARLQLQLSRFPASIERVALCATLASTQGASATLEQLRSLELSLTLADGQAAIQYAVPLNGRQEAALIVAELYRRQGAWKLRAVGQGFVGGLAPLARSFGVDVEDDTSNATPPPPPAASSAHAGATPPPAPTVGNTTGARATPPPPPAASNASSASASQRQVNLQKRLVQLEKKDPELVNLVKKVGVSLEKRGLRDHSAQVALCLDISGSMHSLYQSGAVHTLVKRVLALGLQFDDDGQIEVFLFGKRAYYAGTVGLDNYQTCVADFQQRYPLEGDTRYDLAMSQLRSHYQTQAEFGRTPVFVMFVTDGDTSSKNEAERQLREASHEGIFWKFMAIGAVRKGWFGNSFAFLEGLDNLSGRAVDNADFFTVENPATVAEDQLYETLINEYPQWLNAARQARVLRS